MPQFLRAEDVQIAYAAGVRAAYLTDDTDRQLAVLIAHGRNERRAQEPGRYRDSAGAAREMNAETDAGFAYVRRTRFHEDFGTTGAVPGSVDSTEDQP